MYFRVRVETAVTGARLCARAEFSREQNIINQRGGEWNKMRDTPLSNCERNFLLKAIEEKKVSLDLVGEFGGGSCTWAPKCSIYDCCA